MFSTRALLLVSAMAALGACSGGGGGGGANGGDGTPTVLYPIDNVDAQTLQNNVGVQDGVERTMEGAVTRVGSTNGRFLINYGSENDDGDRTDPRMEAGLNTGGTGELTTEVVIQNSNDTLIMNGQVVRADASQADVFYLPSSGSNTHVGMVRRVTSDYGGVGIFGNRTSSADMANLNSNEVVATYSGVAEVNVNDDINQTTHGYNGNITATADFGNNSLAYNAGNLTRHTNTGGPGSLTLQGDAVVSGNGRVNGTFSTTGAATTSGTTTGSFYGPNAASLGLIFVDPNADVAGGAILNQN